MTVVSWLFNLGRFLLLPPCRSLFSCKIWLNRGHDGELRSHTPKTSFWTPSRPQSAKFIIYTVLRFNNLLTITSTGKSVKYSWSGGRACYSHGASWWISCVGTECSTISKYLPVSGLLVSIALKAVTFCIQVVTYFQLFFSLSLWRVFWHVVMWFKIYLKGGRYVVRWCPP